MESETIIVTSEDKFSTAEQFTNHFDPPLKLSGNWEVGLKAISCSNQVETIQYGSDEAYIQFKWMNKRDRLGRFLMGQTRLTFSKFHWIQPEEIVKQITTHECFRNTTQIVHYTQKEIIKLVHENKISDVDATNPMGDYVFSSVDCNELFEIHMDPISNKLGIRIKTENWITSKMTELLVITSSAARRNAGVKFGNLIGAITDTENQVLEKYILIVQPEPSSRVFTYFPFPDLLCR